MTCLRIVFVAFFLLSFTGTVSPQGTNPQPGATGTGGGGAGRGTGSAAQATYEEIEILRRILGKRLAKLYPQPNPALASWYFSQVAPNSPAAPQQLGTALVPDPAQSYWRATRDLHATANPNWAYYYLAQGEAANPQPSLEGVHLRGQGIVYTVTLPALPRNPTARKPAAPAKTVSEWERLRKEIRGEKQQAESSPEPRQPSMTETILKVLAEQGHNLSHLGDGESVTVVVTFRSTVPSQRVLGEYLNERRGLYDVGSTGPPDSAPRAAAPASVLAQRSGSGAGTSESPAGAPRNPRTARDHLLLGELHLKQGRYDEALAALKTAQELLSKDVSQGGPAADVAQKLAQVYTAKGDVDGARKALDAYVTLRQRRAAEPPAKPATSRTAALPARLIISVPKKLLTQFHAGRMSLDEFQQQASVEYFTFTSSSSTTTGSTGGSSLQQLANPLVGGVDERP